MHHNFPRRNSPKQQTKYAPISQEQSTNANRSVAYERYQLGHGSVKRANTAKHVRVSQESLQSSTCSNGPNGSTKRKTQGRSTQDWIRSTANVYQSNLLTKQYNARNSEKLDRGSYKFIETFCSWQLWYCIMGPTQRPSTCLSSMPCGGLSTILGVWISRRSTKARRR